MSLMKNVNKMVYTGGSTLITSSPEGQEYKVPADLDEEFAPEADGSSAYVPRSAASIPGDNGVKVGPYQSLLCLSRITNVIQGRSLTLARQTCLLKYLCRQAFLFTPSPNSSRQELGITIKALWSNLFS